MPLPSIIEQSLLRWADAFFDRRPQSTPLKKHLQQCKIISHRGQHDNLVTGENTMAAFEQAAAAGVWGIELDLRWTRDLEPVVFHDQDLWRRHGSRKTISAMSFSEIRKQFPAIPALSEVVHCFGGRLHLMVEIKRQPWLNQAKQVRRLQAIMSPLKPSADYHLITCHPEILAPIGHIPLHANVAIAEYCPVLRSRWVRRRSWGGLCSHYLLLPDHMVRSHHRYGQQVGTGYIQSRNCLFREINRGIDWIFSNDAVGMQRMLNDQL